MFDSHNKADKCIVSKIKTVSSKCGENSIGKLINEIFKQKFYFWKYFELT